MISVRKNEKGFTLVELVIVITILAILSAIGLQSYGRSITQAKAQTDIEIANQIAAAAIKAMSEGAISDYSNGANIDSQGGTAAGSYLMSNETNTSTAAILAAMTAVGTWSTGTAVPAAPTPSYEIVSGRFMESIPLPKSYKYNNAWYIRTENDTGKVRVFVVGNNTSAATANNVTMLYPKIVSAWPDAPFNSVK